MILNVRKHLVTLLLFVAVSASAKVVNGYIVTKQGGKLQGHIRVTSVHFPSGAVSINNINYVPLYVSVFFKEADTKRFKEYYAHDIDGFSFFYDKQQIFFFSIALPVKEWNKIKMQKKFLRLVINGHLVLFDHKSLLRFGNSYSEVTDYYISDANNIVYDLSKNEYVSLEDFLVKQLKMEKEFLRNQPYKIHIRNIKSIVLNYNRWKNSKPE